MTCQKVMRRNPGLICLHGFSARVILLIAPRYNLLDIAPRDRNAWDIHLNAAEFVVSSNKQGCPVVAAEGQVGRDAVTKQDRTEMLAAGIDDPDATRPGTIDVALNIHFHTVGDAASGAA